MSPRFLHTVAAVVFATAGLAANTAQAIAVVSQPSELVTYKFNFDDVSRTLSTSSPSLSGYGLGTIGLSDSISLAMTTQLKGATGNTSTAVTVTGAVATQNYNGEGRVAKTLGNSEAGVQGVPLKMDTFLVNNNFRAVKQNATTAVAGSVASPDRFNLTFTNFTVTGIQFDYEIFPDATCARYSGCGPDMTVLAGLTQIWNLQTAPSNRIDPQALGTSSALTFAGTNSLTFIDWPSEIGIDNLVITGCVNAVNGSCTPSKVPEPASTLLVGAGLLGLVARRRKMKA